MDMNLTSAPEKEHSGNPEQILRMVSTFYPFLTLHRVGEEELSCHTLGTEPMRRHAQFPPLPWAPGAQRDISDQMQSENLIF